jgi:hypothetical protein
MYRPSGAVNDRTANPTVSTVGYVVPSLRDFGQYKIGCRTIIVVEFNCGTGS